jgi:hypothetical protein
MRKITFMGSSSIQASFAKDNKKKEYVKMDFKGYGGVGKTKVPLMDSKKEMALTGGLGGGLGFLSQAKKGWKAKLAGATIGGVGGAGVAYLGRKRLRDIDGRSDKGKKRK